MPYAKYGTQIFFLCSIVEFLGFVLVLINHVKIFIIYYHSRPYLFLFLTRNKGVSVSLTLKSSQNIANNFDIEQI